MRRRLIQFGTVLILTVCLWGHVSEIFDHWDNTFQTGNDVEYSTVIAVLTLGAVIGFAHIAGFSLRTVMSYLLPLFAASPLSTPRPIAFLGHSPPQTLRI